MTIRLLLLHNGCIVDNCDTDIDESYTGVRWPVTIDTPGEYELLVDINPDGKVMVDAHTQALFKKLMSKPVTLTIKRKKD